MLGIFDSGIGGLTVVRELLKRSPETPFVYLGDTARTPYGNKAPETVQRYAVEDARFLIDHGATDIVVACNTASALALDVLRSTFPAIRFFDVISPAVQAVVDSTFQKIGVIGTRATIGSGIYERRLKDARPKLSVLSVACPLFVPLVEENWMDQPETKRIVRRYLAPLKQKQLDALILGCTHYPLLQPVIRASLQRRVRIIDSPSALFDQIEHTASEILLPLTKGEREGVQQYYFTDISAHTDRVASRWLGRTVKGERAVLV